jgi:hypothetical protein
MDEYRRIEKVVDSVSKAQESVEINRNQCKRLAEVYIEIWQSLHKVIQNNVEKYNTAWLKALDPLVKVMEVGMHLVLGNAEPGWFQSLITYADNKEAFEEVHRDLHLWAQHLLQINLGKEFNPSDLITDACWDRQEMASKLIDMQCEQNQGEQVRIPSSFLMIAISKLLKQLDNSPLLNSEGDIVEPQANYIIETKLKASLEERRLVHVTLSYLQVAPPPSPAGYVGSPVHEEMEPHLRIPWSDVKIIDERPLGSGYSSNVKRAIWLGAEVAVKIFKSTDVSLRVLRNEVVNHQKLIHPRIVQLLGFSEKDGQGMILMELQEFNLHTLIEEKHRALVRPNQQPFPHLTAIRMMVDIAAGMSFVHSRGKMKHGDLKTENVLGICTEGGNYKLKVADFGETRREITTKSGSGIFRAPEVLVDGGEYTFKSEVYSFAMISYQILTGQVPFQRENLRENLGEVQRKIILGKRPDFPKHMDTKFKSLLQKYWHQDQNRRPTFSEICDELRNVQTEFAPQLPKRKRIRRFFEKL